MVFTKNFTRRNCSSIEPECKFPSRISDKISSVNFPFKTSITFRAGQLRFVTILFLSNLESKIAALLLEMQENTADFVKLGELQAEIDLFNDEKDEIEMTLLEAIEELENL
ncbi:hypothetical protein [Lactococcus lactis]|uniref:hypothetical protein n=1 Tax=Lactococcus lactis TaxID=1358 RepID=UPI00288D2D5C|nr:hypothetical protein [Lactococcus lactis]MDT2908622.1 hypothetical protein [Lactococcus lactis]MDT2924374.1 hypothetical protein [Lactococcus lactis]